MPIMVTKRAGQVSAINHSRKTIATPSHRTVLVRRRSTWANGLNNRPKAGFPKEVLNWSRPLPSNQHTKPSEEFLRESAEVLKGFSNGQSLLDYLKIKFSNSQHYTEKNS